MMQHYKLQNDALHLKALEEIKQNSVITLKYYSNFSNSEEFQFNISDIDYCATTGNQSTMIITNQQIRKMYTLINTAKNDLISALELYYYLLNIFLILILTILLVL